MPRKSRSSNGGAVVSVDTDQADPKKAVHRLESGEKDDEGLPPQEDSEVSEQERRHSEWLDKNRAMNKRVGRMQRVFDQRMADQEARFQRQLRGLQKENQALKARRTTDEPASDAEHESQMKALEQQLEKAMEEGNSATVAKLQREIARKESAFWAAKQAALTGGNDRRGARGDEPDPADDPAADPQQQQRKPSRQGLAFTESNDWWDDPEYRAERGAANAIHAQLVEDEGSDPATEEHYARVAKRLHEKFPDLELNVPGYEDEDWDEFNEDDLEEGRSQRRSRRAARAPVQSQRSREEDPQRAARRGTHLNESDLKFMRSIGLNPDKESHLIAFANGRREADQAERDRRGR